MPVLAYEDDGPERRRKAARAELARRRIVLECALSMALHERAVAVSDALRANLEVRLLRVDLEALDREAARL
jgi:hypothetical protein